MSNKGFTLLEMTLVLCCISICILLAPSLLHRNSGLVFECERIKDILIQSQWYAQNNKEEVVVSVNNDRIQTTLKDYTLFGGVTCTPIDFIFNEKGNVNMANTITCFQTEKSRSIVVTLGKASIYVK